MGRSGTCKENQLVSKMDSAFYMVPLERVELPYLSAVRHHTNIQADWSETLDVSLNSKYFSKIQG